PPPWFIPTQAELDKLEALLRPKFRIPLSEYKDVKWWFSATAVAIDFLQKLTVRQRSQLRRIVIKETHKAVSAPQCHSRGLIPYCVDNPRLRIEVQIGLWTNIMPTGWSFIELDFDDHLGGGECLEAFVLWVDEILLLSSHGMPQQALSIVLEMKAAKSMKMWRLIKRAAGLQEAMIECYRRHGRTEFPSRFEDTDPQYPYPCNLPVWFSEAIRDIVQGTSILRLDGNAGELWDTEELIKEGRDWSEAEWALVWTMNVLGVQIWSREAWEQYMLPRYRFDHSVPAG
ncbi:hypothetical protein BDV95DRAFT_504370, partial [Massariosphaeria phaeospora]